MRRNDHDVINAVRTTDPVAVGDEVIRLFKGLFDGGANRPLKRAFRDAARLYGGEHPDYCACDTEYHDIQHVLDVTLAMARLMDGYQRSLQNGAERLTRELFIVGALAALFHDFGYLRRRGDHLHRHGAEYTLIHVSRGSTFLRHYVRSLGLSESMAHLAATLVHFTGYERPAETIRLSGTLERRLGQMLGTADIIAQMSDRCYLEKCRDRLYPEFVLGRLAGEASGRLVERAYNLPVFASGDDLVHKTPGFYVGATKRLNLQLARSYDYATRHFHGTNPYLDAMETNVKYAQRVAHEPDVGPLLRRRPPRTLAPEAVPYPAGLIARPARAAAASSVSTL
jgi:hypothetical protein